MTSPTPNIFDTFVTEVIRNLDEVLADLANDFAGPENGEAEADTTPASETTETTETGLTPAFFAREAIRILKRAEVAASVDKGYQLAAVADRYIRLSEIALLD